MRWMERLPSELLCSKIFTRLDHRSLATVLQVCCKWKSLASDDTLWRDLFRERWGTDNADFYDPLDHEDDHNSPTNNKRSWKHVYEVQDRCDRFGVGLKVIREGGDYYLIHQGEIQRFLGSSSSSSEEEEEKDQHEKKKEGEEEETTRRLEISEKMLFFLGDLETASSHARRKKMKLEGPPNELQS